uniref:BTB domain-containing protein n=1 Tax=Leersia perrieri TaxID=77586 RepID=A0A0D9XW61_9ORYZ
MDCCICSPMASMYRPPRNTICAACYEGAKSIIAFFNDDEHADADQGSVKSRGLAKLNTATKRLRDAWEEVKQMRCREEETNQRVSFLQEGFAAAWKEGIHTDIAVKPGTGPPIQAHKAILAARSEVFRHILAGDDEYKAAAGESISLPELSHDELSHLLAFLYTGSLPPCTEEERQLHALLVAGDKYDVAYLRRACEGRLAARVDAGNALRTLEVAELSSSAALMERAMGTVVEHAEEVVFSPEYQDFAVRNASLCVQITRALLAAGNKSTFPAKTSA